MNAGSDHGSAAKVSAIDLEVIGSGPVGCCFSFPPLSLPCVLCFFYMIAKQYITIKGKQSKQSSIRGY